MPASCCESCVNCVFEEDSQQYLCMVELDEDEVSRFYSQPYYACPYYKLDDEYSIVNKQN